MLKPSAATPNLMQHTGRAVVFENIEHYQARASTIPTRYRRELGDGAEELRPQGLSGHGRGRQHAAAAEAAEKGITDMVRISDARMSGTAYGTVVLHVCPEAEGGGALALVRNGDMITLDVPGRSLSLEVDEATLKQRRLQWTAPPGPQRGWAKLYVDHVLQADEGADLDFLVGSSGAPIPRDSH